MLQERRSEENREKLPVPEPESESEKKEESLKKLKDEIADCRPMVLGMCRKLLRGNPDAETLAEDIAQETMMKAIKYAKNFKGESKLTSWLGTIARNIIASHFRAPKNKPMMGIEDLGKIPSDFGGEEELIFAMDAERILEKRRMAIAQLKQEGKIDATDENILRLRYLEGLQLAQVAEQLGMEKNTVRSRLSRVRGKFDKALGAQRT